MFPIVRVRAVLLYRSYEYEQSFSIDRTSTSSPSLSIVRVRAVLLYKPRYVQSFARGAPLSEVKKTTVLSPTPSLSNTANSCPTASSSSWTASPTGPRVDVLQNVSDAKFGACTWEKATYLHSLKCESLKWAPARQHKMAEVVCHLLDLERNTDGVLRARTCEGTE